ncbi:hypothetical protein HU200_011967 [Digitaria exilis]|uniref:Pectinesterase inhibitor domain-containing protein n=1 Tax=Digitaria exilis TaxID=1010633 RepID=A0A835FFH7_9POAL|nr:hypothetical protein HU200_011967 [Digitaria exilis]
MSLPSVLVVILATIFAAAHMAAAAAADARPSPPLVANLPASAAAQDFVRSRCGESCRMRPKAARECNKLLLPFATSINGSYVGASLAGTTAMISELTAFVRDMRELDRAWPEYKLGGCIRMAEGAVGGAKEQMATLSRFYALGDDKVGEFGLSEVMKWIRVVMTGFQHECSDGGLKNVVDLSKELPRARVVDKYIYVSLHLICFPTPYAMNFLGSPVDNQSKDA